MCFWIDLVAGAPVHHRVPLIALHYCGLHQNWGKMANFVFCIAHFCEIHGPVTVLCTQKHQSDALLSESSYALCESCSLALPAGVTSLVTNIEARDDPEHLTSDCNIANPQVTTNLRINEQKDAQKSSDRTKHTDRISYASTQNPQSERIFTCVTKLVMKCLSVEAVAEPLKPVFFGDTNTGYCLCKIFSIPDLHARGGERKYSLMVVGDSESGLLNNWDIASSYIAEIISLLQQWVETRMEQRKFDSSDNGRYLRRAKIMPRSLVQLTGDEQIFMKLHLCGTELLSNMQIQ